MAVRISLLRIRSPTHCQPAPRGERLQCREVLMNNRASESEIDLSKVEACLDLSKIGLYRYTGIAYNPLWFSALSEIERQEFWSRKQLQEALKLSSQFGQELENLPVISLPIGDRPRGRASPCRHPCGSLACRGLQCGRDLYLSCTKKCPQRLTGSADKLRFALQFLPCTAGRIAIMVQKALNKEYDADIAFAIGAVLSAHPARPQTGKFLFPSAQGVLRQLGNLCNLANAVVEFRIQSASGFR